jgi:hypothetical protein
MGRLVIGIIWWLTIGDNGLMGTFYYTQLTAMAAMRVNKRRLNPFKSDNGLKFARLPGRAFFTTAAARRINVYHGFCHGALRMALTMAFCLQV